MHRITVCTEFILKNHFQPWRNNFHKEIGTREVLPNRPLKFGPSNLIDSIKKQDIVGT
jgi:hypothetical protein